jgi:hypothetical protein
MLAMTLLSARARRALACACLLSCLVARAARADSPDRDAVVVEVSPPGSLDAYRLRAAIGIELGVDAVGSDDPRARTARGTLRVGVDEKSHRLTVSYRKRDEPVDRTVDLPTDPEAAQRAAVALAGNLGRDEASELAAQLRKTPTVPPAEHPEPALPKAQDPAAAQEREDEANGRDLQTALAYAAAQDRRLRSALALTLGAFTVVAVGAALASPAVNHQPFNGDAFATAVSIGALPGASIACTAFMLTMVGGGLDQVIDESRRNGGDPTKTAEAWLRVAARERSLRKVGGAILIVAGVIDVALGTFLAMDQTPQVDCGLRTADAATGLGSGAFFTILGVIFQASDGPAESALHGYEQAHRIPLWGLAQHVALAPTPGGASATFSATF